MASKKSKITSLLLSNTPDFAAAFFCVGSLPLNSHGEVCTTQANTQDGEAVPAFPVVRKIVFCKHAFGKGAQIDQPCYAIYFEDASEILIVRANAFCQITVTVAEKEKAEVPVLPEN